MQPSESGAGTLLPKICGPRKIDQGLILIKFNPFCLHRSCSPQLFTPQ